MKRIIKRNKNKISRAFRDAAYWSGVLSMCEGKRNYSHQRSGEFVWISSK